jgi:hypothetical protein
MIRINNLNKFYNINLNKFSNNFIENHAGHYDENGKINKKIFKKLKKRLSKLNVIEMPDTENFNKLLNILYEPEEAEIVSNV